MIKEVNSQVLNVVQGGIWVNTISERHLNDNSDGIFIYFVFSTTHEKTKQKNVLVHLAILSGVYMLSGTLNLKPIGSY